MHFAKNIILVLCIIFNPGKPGNDLFIKPSVYIMPREVFTNQANWELAKKNQRNKVFPECVNIYNGSRMHIMQRDFRIKMPFPDLIVFLKNKKPNKYMVQRFPRISNYDYTLNSLNLPSDKNTSMPTDGMVADPFALTVIPGNFIKKRKQVYNELADN